MKINRKKLLDHFEAIACDGLVTEAAFSGAFATVAKAEDGSVIVETSGLSDIEELDVEAGFGLKIVTAALREDPVDEVEIGLSQRLFLGTGRISLALVTTDPGNTTTRVDDKLLQAVKTVAAVEGEGYPLDADAVRAFLSLSKLLPNAKDVRIVLGKESGVRLGQGTENQGQVVLPGIVFEAQTERLLPVQAFKSVLSLVGSDARIWFGPEPSPHGAVTIKSGACTYYMSVMAEETR